MVLHIEHSAVDYDAWKVLFDKDPADRKGSGVRHYRISRGVEDPSLVTIDLAFDDLAAAETMLARLKPIWAGSASDVISNVSGRLVTIEEEATL